MILEVRSDFIPFREKFSHGPTDGLGPGNAMFFAVSVQGPDLFVGKVYDCSHGDIIT